MNDFYSAQLQAQKIQEDTGLSLDEILKLDMDAYARLTGRLTVRQLVAQAAEKESPGKPLPEAPAFPDTPDPALGGAGIDLQSMSMAQYAQLRGQLGVGRGQKEGRGIFDSVGSASEEYVNAVRAQSGRTGWNTSNVVESPQLPRAFVHQEQPPTYRSAADRFTTAGNVFGN